MAKRRPNASPTGISKKYGSHPNNPIPNLGSNIYEVLLRALANLKAAVEEACARVTHDPLPVRRG